MKTFRYILFLLIFISLSLSGFSQEPAGPRKVIQFSGVVVTGDSLMPVPYVNIFVKNKFYGASTDYYGYFSLPAVCGDTLTFSSLGYKKSIYIIPQDLNEDRYSIVHVVHADTLLLHETVIYPWPSREEFRDAFMNLNIPDDEIARAEKNLDPEALYKQSLTMPSNGSMNFKYQMQLKQQQLYYNGQAPPITVLNPFAWAQFIKAWKEGKFKRQEKDRD